MQERRWWLTAAVIVLFGALPAGFAATATATAPAAVTFVSALDAPDAPKIPVWTDPAGAATVEAYVKYWASAMTKAPNWAEASGIRGRVESAILPSRENAGQPPFAVRTAYNKSVIDGFGPLVTSANEAVAVNSTILVARLEDQFADGVLADALASRSPAVRYWSAKGLGAIISKLKLVEQAYTRDLFGGDRGGVKVVGIVPAMQAEKSPLTRGELMRAAALAGNPQAAAEVGKALQGLASEMAAKPLDTDMLVAARAGLEGLTVALRGNPMALGKAEQSAVVQGAADVMATTAQRLWASSTAGNTPAGAAVQSAAKETAQAAVQAINAVAAANGLRTVPAPANLDKMNAADLLAAVNDITGTPAIPQGKLQANWPDVKAPPRIK